MALLMLPRPVFVHLLVLRPSAARHDRLVFEPGVGEATEAAKTVAHEAGAGGDVSLRIGLDGP